MDVSASTSFESNNGTPDKKGHSFIGDSTLYDSALDHQLSTTVYKSCNGKLILWYEVNVYLRDCLLVNNCFKGPIWLPKKHK